MASKAQHENKSQKHTAANSPSRTPVKLSTAPWKQNLPGKILVVCICVLPFLTYSILAPMSDEVHDAFFLISGANYYDFEQLCREIALLVIAAFFLIWFVVERFTLRPRRTLPLKKISITLFLCLGGYLLLGLLSTLFSDYTMESWIGSYTLYEGYLALLGYGIVFAAAWYFIDSQNVISFVQKALTILGIVVGIFALLEYAGTCYYNLSIIQTLSHINGTVSFTGDVVLTFGNADYLGLYCAILLPVQVSTISLKDSTTWLLAKILSAVLLATTLILTHVSNTILFGFGATLIFLLIWMLHLNWKKMMKLSVVCVVILAIFGSGFGFLYSRNGTTLSEKLEHTLIGAETEQTFQLLEIGMEDTTITLENKTTILTIVADAGDLSSDTLTFYCNDDVITPNISGGEITFAESELEHCAITVDTDEMLIDLGYSTSLDMIWNRDSWQIVGIGGTILDSVPQVSDSKTLQSKYTYLNGRVFIWTNTAALLGDCILLGHGPATSVLYLEQNDLPALLNIFSKYVLFNKPHNWYLQMAQDTGVVSMLLIVGMLGIFIVSGARQCFGKKRKWNPWRTGLWFSVITYALCGIMGDSLVYHAPMFWFLFGMAMRQVTVKDEVQAA